jgi:flagellar biogenesis protein FliO
MAGAAARTPPASMDIIETLVTGQGRSIMLVRVTDSVLVVAQTSQNTTLLDKLEGQKALDVITSSRGGANVTQFKDLFGNFLGKIKKQA